MKKPHVHILATCRRPELMAMTTLVFQTLRIGFPTAEVFVHINDVPGGPSPAPIAKEAERVGAHLYGSIDWRHDAWIDRLLQGNSPIVICDTDMVFHESVEDWQFAEPLAGALEPDHCNPVSQARHLKRLHTSLLFARPVEIRDRVRQWCAQRPQVPYHVAPQLVRQQWLPLFGQTWFADTCALLCDAIGGQSFTEAQREAFTHLHCGTWSDIAGREIPGLKDAHARAVKEPQSVRGLWRTYEQWYSEHA